MRVYSREDEVPKMAIDELYLDNLDEFINDECKVVTYKSLSRSIAVHVNQAKQMLHTFVQHQRNEKNNDALMVTYLLAGSVKDENAPSEISHKVCIVPEDQLEAAKSRMNQVTSCHVYSVQHSKIKDTGVLYNVDYAILHEHLLTSNRHSAITYASAKKRSEHELDLLRKKGAEAYAPSYKPKSASSVNGQQAKKAQSGAIESMFGKAATKKDTTKPTAKPEEKVESKPDEAKESKTSGKGVKKTGGIASMFAKQAAKPAISKPAAPDPAETKKTDEATKVDNEGPPKKASPEPKKSKAVKSKKDADKHAKESGKQNKRRRIKQMEVSSSSEDEMEMIPPTPPREPTPEPTPEPSPEPTNPKSDEEIERTKEPVNHTQATEVRRRKRRRKHVDKTFVDDDGFMVTEKVWESESCTDASDIEEPPKKAALPPPKSKDQPKQEKKDAQKKTSPNKAKGKQASLMSFFKKK